MIDAGGSRNYVNKNVGRIETLFRWAVEEELIPPTVYHALQAVRGLKRGRSEPRETEPIRAVRSSHVDAVKPHVSRQVWALIEVQRLTAARSGELLGIRTSCGICERRNSARSTASRSRG